MEFDLKNVKEFEPNTIFLEDGQFLENYKSENIDLTDGLPNGILDKRYTGVGATTVEIKSSRKSIIVFPFRKLALEKFEKYEKTKIVFYVGTDKNSKSKSINDIKKFASANSDKNIKFLVVADSIDKVIEGIKKANQDPYKEYFMTLDEVEILQMQSGFRSKLPLCFDYFKKFERKCFVSATLLTFTDEDLLNLPKYQVLKYKSSREEGIISHQENLSIRKYNSNLPHLAVAKDLIEFYKNKLNIQHKFFIGLNSKEGINQFIEEFEKGNSEIKISVIISETGRTGILTKYQGEIVDGKLPSNITLTTCVAWSGIDILEPYFAIAISLNTKLHHRFSFENLIQFFGRCRIPNRSQLMKTFVLGMDYSIQKKRISSVETRMSELDSLIKYIYKNISNKSDRVSILNDLCESNNPLIYKGIDEKPHPNWLINDLENYNNSIIEDYLEDQKSLIARLNFFYNIILKDTEDYSFLELINKSTEEKETINLEALIDNLNKRKINNQQLVNIIKTPNPSNKKIAAYWYLFGEIILKNHNDGLKLAKHYSGFENSEVGKFVKPVTNIVLDSLYLYTFDRIIWNNFLADLESVSKGVNKKSNEFLKVFEKPEYNSYFNSILKKGDTSKNINYFMKHVLGLSYKTISKGSQTFLIEVGGKYKPSILNIAPKLNVELPKIIKKKISDQDQLSFKNINSNSLLNERFV